VLTTIGAGVHLAHPLGVKAFAYRRVTNDFRDAADLADLLRMVGCRKAWIAPPQVRDLRQLVRHRAKLVAVGSAWKCQVHPGLGRLRGRGADERPVRPGRQPAAGPPAVADQLRCAGQLAAAAAGPAGRRDRPVWRHGGCQAGAPSRLPGDPAHRRARAGAGGGAGRRDRRRYPLPRPRPAGQLGRADSPPSRVRHPRPPRQDHQAGLPAAPAGQPSKRCSASARRPGWGRSANASPRAAAATSAWSPQLASLSVWPTPGCATATSAAWQHEPTRTRLARVVQVTTPICDGVVAPSV
jgi:hypothetical protein